MRRFTTSVLVGGLLFVAGAVLLLRQIFTWFDAGVIWPLLVLAVGAVVIVSAMRGRRDR